MVGKIFQIYGYCILLKNALASQKNENRYFYPKNDIFTHAPAGSYHQICLETEGNDSYPRKHFLEIYSGH